MTGRWRPILFATALGLASLSLDPADAAAPATHAAARSSARAVSLAAPSARTEGDRYRVVAKVAHLRAARRITFQQLLPEYGTYGDPMWKNVRTKRIAGRRSLILRLVADATSSQRTRAVVQYSSGRRVTSKPATVTIWHWTNLNAFDAYYETNDINDYEYSSFAMNGDSWLGWYAYGAHPMWESRYTLGRNCKAFRGTLGVTDGSSDGASASVTLLTGEGVVVYTSPGLVPGAVTPVQIKLDRPYRFSIQARDTTDATVAHTVYPAIGVPQFLCHFG